MIKYIFYQLDLYRAYENREPESIYLGYDEMRRFMADTNSLMNIVLTNKDSVKGMEFNGLKVFEVCQENHFNIC